MHAVKMKTGRGYGLLSASRWSPGEWVTSLLPSVTSLMTTWKRQKTDKLKTSHPSWQSGPFRVSYAWYLQSSTIQSCIYVYTYLWRETDVHSCISTLVFNIVPYYAVSNRYCLLCVRGKYECIQDRQPHTQGVHGSWFRVHQTSQRTVTTPNLQVLPY